MSSLKTMLYPEMYASRGSIVSGARSLCRYTVCFRIVFSVSKMTLKEKPQDALAQRNKGKEKTSSPLRFKVSDGWRQNLKGIKLLFFNFREFKDNAFEKLFFNLKPCIIFSTGTLRVYLPFYMMRVFSKALFKREWHETIILAKLQTIW